MSGVTFMVTEEGWLYPCCLPLCTIPAASGLGMAFSPREVQTGADAEVTSAGGGTSFPAFAIEGKGILGYLVMHVRGLD
jgi:hypothetical protein